MAKKQIMHALFIHKPIALPLLGPQQFRQWSVYVCKGNVAVERAKKELHPKACNNKCLPKLIT